MITGAPTKSMLDIIIRDAEDLITDLKTIKSSTDIHHNTSRIIDAHEAIEHFSDTANRRLMTMAATLHNYRR